MDERRFGSEAEILKALAQPTRLKIIESLRKRGRYICEICTVVNGEQSNISRHISLMQRNHLVTTRKDGVKVFVKVRDPKIFEILDSVSIVIKKQVNEQSRLVRRL